MKDEEFREFIARTKEDNRKGEEEARSGQHEGQKAWGAIANAQDPGRSLCSVTGHAYRVLGEPLVEYESVTPGNVFKFISRVRYSLFCSKCGHVIEYTHDRRNNAK